MGAARRGSTMATHVFCKPREQHTLNAKISGQRAYPSPCSEIVSVFGDRSATNDNQCATRRGARMHNVALVLGAPLSALSREVAVLRGVTPALLTTPAATLGLLRLIVAASCSPLRQRSRCRGARQHLRRCAIVAAPFRLKPKGVPKTITETRARSPHRLQKQSKPCHQNWNQMACPNQGRKVVPVFACICKSIVCARLAEKRSRMWHRFGFPKLGPHATSGVIARPHVRCLKLAREAAKI